MFKRSASPHRLQAIPLFAGCSRDELAALDAVLTEVRLDAGQVVAREDHYGAEALIVAEGQVAVTRSARRDGPVAILGPGAVVGELALLDGTPRTATVTAVTPTIVYVANPREFSVLMSIPSVADAIRATADARRAANETANQAA